MEKRPRCVVVSPVVPSEIGSGLQQRAFQVWRLLTERFETTVLVICEPAKATLHPLPEALASSITIFPIDEKLSLGKRLARWIPPLVLLRPGWSTDWPEITARPLLPVAGEAPLALCVVFRLRMHQVARLLTTCQKPRKTVLDLDDIESLTLAGIGFFALRRARVLLGLNSFSKALQAFCLERMLLPRYDRVYLANPKDLDRLRLLAGDARLQYLPNRVSLPTGALSRPAPSQLGTMLFIGTLGYFPNEDAVLWLLESILPELRRCINSPFRLRLAGRRASARLSARMHGTSDVEFLGEVSDVKSLYAEANVALVVVRCGGGTKIKALEAVAHQCPIVGTSHAMQGLGFSSHQDYLCANTAADVARCCAYLLRQPEAARAMAKSAYERLASRSPATSEEATSDNFPS